MAAREPNGSQTKFAREPNGSLPMAAREPNGSLPMAAREPNGSLPMAAREPNGSHKKPKKVVAKAKKPKKVHPKKYVCYHEGCKEEFPQWKLARDHMTNEHETKDPKLKKSIVYLDAKGEPKAAPRGAPKVVAYPVRPSVASTQSVVRPRQESGSESLAQLTMEQCDTIKMRETPKVLATAPGRESVGGHRGNDLGQFGPNWVRNWGSNATFFPNGNNAKNVTMDDPQQSSFNYGRMFRD